MGLSERLVCKPFGCGCNKMLHSRLSDKREPEAILNTSRSGSKTTKPLRGTDDPLPIVADHYLGDEFGEKREAVTWHGSRRVQRLKGYGLQSDVGK